MRPTKRSETRQADLYTTKQCDARQQGGDWKRNKATRWGLEAKQGNKVGTGSETRQQGGDWKRNKVRERKTRQVNQSKEVSLTRPDAQADMGLRRAHISCL